MTRFLNHTYLRPILAALIVWISCAWIENSRPGWNANSQFALTLAIVEQGTLRIDDYHDHPAVETGDKAFFEGHFYSDKSPVTPFLGVPSLTAFSLLNRNNHSLDFNRARYWTTLGTIGVCAALYTFLLALLLMRWSVPPGRASMVAAAWVLATPLYGYSILFFNYMPACLFALGGTMLIEPRFRSEYQAPPNTGSDHRRLFLAGVLIGLASWTLQTVGLLAIALSLGLVAKMIERNNLRSIWKLWPWATGGIMGASGYVVYSLIIFGRVANPYEYEFDPYFRESMQRGFMGASWPDLRIAGLLTFHPFRGLFVLFPITLPAVIGAVWTGYRYPQFRVFTAVAVGFLLSMILYNSGYYMWWGGWSYAPRHLIVALALVPVGLVPFLVHKHRIGRLVRGVLLILFIASMLMNIGVIALDPQPPPMMPEEALLEPETIEKWIYPNFEIMRFVKQGQLDGNLGKRVGLDGIYSLAPLLLIWCLGFGCILLLSSRGGPDQGAGSADQEQSHESKL